MGATELRVRVIEVPDTSDSVHWSQVIALLLTAGGRSADRDPGDRTPEAA